MRSSGYCFSKISIGLFASSISDIECQCYPCCSCFWDCLCRIFEILLYVLLVGPGLFWLVTFGLTEEPIMKCLGCSGTDVYNQTAEELWLNGTAFPGCPTRPSWYQPIRPSLSAVALLYLIPALVTSVIWWCSVIGQNLPSLQVRDVCLAALHNIWLAICLTVFQVIQLAIYAFNEIMNLANDSTTFCRITQRTGYVRLTPD